MSGLHHTPACPPHADCREMVTQGPRTPGDPIHLTRFGVAFTPMGAASIGRRLARLVRPKSPDIIMPPPSVRALFPDDAREVHIPLNFILSVIGWLSLLVCGLVVLSRFIA